MRIKSHENAGNLCPGARIPQPSGSPCLGCLSLPATGLYKGCQPALDIELYELVVYVAPSINTRYGGSSLFEILKLTVVVDHGGQDEPRPSPFHINESSLMISGPYPHSLRRANQGTSGVPYCISTV